MKDTKRILIDAGSSSVKVYSYNGVRLVSILTKSISFKEGFKPEIGITEAKQEEFYSIIEFIQKKYSLVPVEIYATALFRSLTNKVKRKLIHDFFKRTGLNFNIISHDEESHYLEQALIGKYSDKLPILLLNIGGGSTEIIIMENGKPLNRYNIPFGMVHVLEKFPTINFHVSGTEISLVIDFVKTKVPGISAKVDRAIYTGGELTYMKLVGYKLQKNTLFQDKEHPSMITFDNFIKKNREVFEKISLRKLEKLMPQNPKWMHGARACSAIAEALFNTYSIKTIIPSNSNLIHGVIREL